jgi:hypothetical protein
MINTIYKSLVYFLYSNKNNENFLMLLIDGKRKNIFNASFKKHQRFLVVSVEFFFKTNALFKTLL